MAAMIGKRKRETLDSKTVHFQKAAKLPAVNGTKSAMSKEPEPKGHSTSADDDNDVQAVPTASVPQPPTGDINVQIVTGSYDRVLHGITASIPSRLLVPSNASESNIVDETSTEIDQVSFSDSFLFAAHTSAIRCLALSPPTQHAKRVLATGSSDERINLYNVSTVAPPKPSRSGNLSILPPSLLSTSKAENPRNRSLGTLNHHDRALTNLYFASKSKLFSSAEDNTIAISRTRDWTLLSSIKAPIPKPHGRPSGDTAAPGEVPAGVNDFAVHPSQKLMLSVGRGERCLRLWNLMTGKKAGVLNFERDVLGQVGEGKYSTGEGRRVLWNESGDLYVVAFERGAVIFGIDSKPKAVIKPSPPTKFHEMHFLPTSEVVEGLSDVLLISTEDGRILFFDTSVSVPDDTVRPASPQNLPQSPCLAQLGGPKTGITGRIKDFEILSLQSSLTGGEQMLTIVSGSSDGAVRIWAVALSEIAPSGALQVDVDGDPEKDESASKEAKQIGRLIGTVETGNRITCLGAFMMDASEDEVHLDGQEDQDGEVVVDQRESDSEDENGE